jgi:hypothetical protein
VHREGVDAVVVESSLHTILTLRKGGAAMEQLDRGPGRRIHLTTQKFCSKNRSHCSG